MALFLARLSRIVPLLLIMAVIAGVVYVTVSYRQSPARAKEVLIKGFTRFSLVLIVFFGIASLYALFESNMAVLDLALMVVAVGVISLVVARICNYVFLKNNPSYRDKPQKAKRIYRWPWEKR